MKRRLHPHTQCAELAPLYARYQAATFATDKAALGKEIVRLQRTLDDTEHSSVFGVIERAYAEVCEGLGGGGVPSGSGGCA
jgi:hypothetical protein